MWVIHHKGKECVHYAKIGDFDKHCYYIREYGKTLPHRDYRPEPRFLSRRLFRITFFRHPYCEWQNKHMDLVRVGSTSHWVPES